METIEEIQREKRESDKFSNYRKEVNEKLPEIARKVFALRKMSYVGCGFHWCLEKNLGWVLAEVNNYDKGSYYHSKQKSDVFMTRTILKVRVKELFKDIERIEKELGYEV